VQVAGIAVSQILADEVGDRRLHGDQLVEVLLADRGGVADVQPEHHLLGYTGAEHDPRSLGIEPKVELSGGRRVAGDVDIAAHEDDPLDLGFNLGSHAEGEGDVGHRADGKDSNLAGITLNLGDQELDPGVMVRFLARQARAGSGLDLVGIVREGAHVFELAPPPLGFPRHGDGVDHRSMRAGVDRDLRTLHQIEDVEHVLGALAGPHVAGNDSDAGNRDLRSPQEHDEGGPVVTEQARVGVEENDVVPGAEKRSSDEQACCHTPHQSDGSRSGYRKTCSKP
jgi:hypothetical protein